MKLKSLIIGLTLSLLSISAYAGGIAMMGCGVAATGCAAGTTLAGNTTHYTGTDATYNADRFVGQLFTASATCTLGKAYIWFRYGVTGNFKFLVYNSSQELIATSNEISNPGDTDWTEFTFTSGPTITNGQTYYIGVITNAAAGLFPEGDAATSENVYYSNAGSEASPPTSISGCDVIANKDHYSWYITN